MAVHFVEFIAPPDVHSENAKYNYLTLNYVAPDSLQRTSCIKGM